MMWVFSNLPLVGELLLAHLAIALPTIVAASLVSIPLAWVAWRHPRWGGPALTGFSLVYAIPSLPMFFLIPVLVGIPLRSRFNIIIALTLYGVAVLVRQIADAFSSVPASVLESADAAGYSPIRRVFAIELPLAIPAIVAGIRVVVVSTVSLTTVGAFIGIRSLGTLFTDGFQRGLVAEVFVGLVATLGLALVLDGIVTYLGQLATPWTKTQRTHVPHQGTRQFGAHA